MFASAFCAQRLPMGSSSHGPQLTAMVTGDLGAMGPRQVPLAEDLVRDIELTQFIGEGEQQRAPSAGGPGRGKSSDLEIEPHPQAVTAVR
ncbi:MULTISPECIES: hypothetical protein [Paenarthrobacter]|uniref:Uncharacterized protein n=1 Tax=Paenarthrobacter ureafaciens TaxID=37931 RepID=A0AAX3EIQ5_PAEUR|nr:MULTISPECIES: hypothetical protein [Paenarthrobacter]MDO5873869.1 hypothetical protein [Paenarthrobacter sp. SD-1]UYV93307.1 hypothetical protein NL395_00910 [Paenarthrobacter ureafaciens]UYV97841.1 hypothetical protein NL394_00910 [Paenarthrobacter ureafaciens]